MRKVEDLVCECGHTYLCHEPGIDMPCVVCPCEAFTEDVED